MQSEINRNRAIRICNAARKNISSFPPTKHNLKTYAHLIRLELSILEVSYRWKQNPVTLTK